MSHCWAPVVCGEWPEETLLPWDLLWARGTETGAESGPNVAGRRWLSGRSLVGAARTVSSLPSYAKPVGLQVLEI